MRRLFALVIFLASASANAQPDGCSSLRAKGEAYQTDRRFKESFDTLKRFIETCPTYSFAYHAFSSIDGALGGWKEGPPSRFADHRPWLLSVLYLNPSEPNYYCAVVNSLMGTFNGASYRDLNGAASMLDYVLKSGKCSEEINALFRRRYLEIREDQVEAWEDTVGANKDDPRYALDSSIRTLEEMGLEALRGLNGVRNTSGSQLMMTLRTDRNPIGDDASIRFELASVAVVSCEVFDISGRKVWSTASSLMQAGPHTIDLNAHEWPGRTYYARLSTTSGEVQTVKLWKR
jgi:hypothetical protein